MIRQLTGDCRNMLKTLPDGSVNCCVTSPPYFGLRDYGTAVWDGGDPDCDHSTSRSRGDDIKPSDKQGTSAGSRPNTQRDCGCGATRIDSQIGLEQTPDAYVAELVAVFREVRRVLADDGTLWLNLGDSYAGSWGARGRGGHTNAARPDLESKYGTAAPARNGFDGIKPKDLIGIPWRVAFALQADGWYLRQDIIWSKPNPMPESVTDRCTKAHEIIFLLSKSARYYFDAEAIAEPGEYCGQQLGIVRGRKVRATAMGRNPSGNEAPGMDAMSPDTRNKRSVWTVPTSSFSEAHFATFPPALIEPCILAGCPVGGTVLDPFGGAGTTGLVADRLGRNAVLIELNPDYAAMSQARIVDDLPLFVEVTA